MSKQTTTTPPDNSGKKTTKPKAPRTKSAPQAGDKADDALSYEEMLGPRPGGGKWRPIELEVARLRAEGHQWAAIHEVINARGIKYSVAGLSNMTYKVWWSHAYNFFAAQRTSAVEAERAAAIEAERDKWRSDDAKLKALGTQLALNKLIEVLRGMRPRDEMAYRGLVKSGVAVDEADAQARGKSKMPSPADVVWAAREMLKATGYTKLNEALAGAAVESEVEARKLIGVPTPGAAGAPQGPRVLKVSVEMDGVDLTTAEDGDDDR